MVGLAVGLALGHGTLACGLAIAVMSMTRSLHPPGGAAALTGALADGHRHAAMVVDAESGMLLGLVTQADLLAALTRHSVDAALTAP